MSNSVIITRPLRKGRQVAAYNKIMFRHNGKDDRIVLPSTMVNEIVGGGYFHLEYRVNTLTNEVFFVFAKTPSTDSLELSFSDEYKRKAKKFTIRNKTINEFLSQDLGITGESVELAVSDNMSNKDTFLTYKITRQ